MMDQQQRRIWLIGQLLREYQEYRDTDEADLPIPHDDEEQRLLLRALQNVRLPAPVSEQFLRVQDEYLDAELVQRTITDANDISRSKPLRLSLPRPKPSRQQAPAPPAAHSPSKTPSHRSPHKPHKPRKPHNPTQHSPSGRATSPPCAAMRSSMRRTAGLPDAMRRTIIASTMRSTAPPACSCASHARGSWNGRGTRSRSAGPRSRRDSICQHATCCTRSVR